MVFICEAAQCYSHTSKLKNIDKHPWMKDLRWVKWPRHDSAAVNRWIRLIRRGGKSEGVIDTLKITRRSRLCSRHFDQEQLSPDGHAISDPKYFEWNNWGQPVRPKKSCRHFC